MNRHPSGKPLRQVKRGISPQVAWPREDFVVPRLNHIRRELPGGFGIPTPMEPEDTMYLETRTGKR